MSGDNTVILWDLTDRNRTRQLDQPLTWNVVAFSPNGHTLAITSDYKSAVL